MSRCEDDLANAFGMDERGALRDWNEDYQNVREMQATTAGERVVRAKILHKVLSDFGEAAVAGAMAVVQGMSDSPPCSLPLALSDFCLLYMTSPPPLRCPKALSLPSIPTNLPRVMSMSLITSSLVMPWIVKTPLKSWKAMSPPSKELYMNFVT